MFTGYDSESESDEEGKECGPCHGADVGAKSVANVSSSSAPTGSSSASASASSKLRGDGMGSTNKESAPLLRSEPTPSSSSSSAKVLPKPKKRVVDYNSLIKGVAKPLDMNALKDEDEFAPVMPRSRPGVLSSLPPPKRSRPIQEIVVPGLSKDEPVMEIKKDSSDEEDNALMQSDEEDAPAVPKSFFNFGNKEEEEEEEEEGDVEERTHVASARGEPVHEMSDEAMGSVPDPIPREPDIIPHLKGLTSKEMEELRTAEMSNALTKVHGDDLNDPDWYLKNAGKKQTVSGIMTDLFNNETRKVGDATILQKRKHQINSLAAEYHEQGAELLEKSSVGKMRQGQTARKYGW